MPAPILAGLGSLIAGLLIDKGYKMAVKPVLRGAVKKGALRSKNAKRISNVGGGASGLVGGTLAYGPLDDLFSGGEDSPVDVDQALRALIAQAIGDDEAAFKNKTTADIGEAMRRGDQAQAIGTMGSDNLNMAKVMATQNMAMLHQQAYKPRPSLMEIMSRVRPDLFQDEMNG